jgi:hypothetical protein
VIQQGGSFTALSFLGSSDPEATYEDLFAVASTGTMFKISVSAGVPSVEQVDLAAARVTAGAVIDIGALPSHSSCYTNRIALISSDDSCVTLWSSELIDDADEVPLMHWTTLSCVVSRMKKNWKKLSLSSGWPDPWQGLG